MSCGTLLQGARQTNKCKEVLERCSVVGCRLLGNLERRHGCCFGELLEELMVIKWTNKPQIDEDSRTGAEVKRYGEDSISS
jgi:hypothetical protein